MTGQFSLCGVTGIFTVSFNLTTYLCAVPPTATTQHCAGIDSTADARHFCTFIFQAPERKYCPRDVV